MRRLKELKNEYIAKREHFGCIDSLKYLLCPHHKKWYPLKHKAILDALEPDFERILRRWGGKFTQNIEPDAPIWVLWLQGRNKMPSIVSACVRSIEANAGAHPVNLLDSSNLGNYVELPAYIENLRQQGKISMAHYSDIVRMALLSKYGGYWMDATVYMTKPLPNYELPFYSLRRSERYGNKIWVCSETGSKWVAYLIGCGKGNVYVKVVYEFFLDYWTHHEHIIDYFLIDYAFALLYKLDKNFRDTVAAVPIDNEDFPKMFENIYCPYTKELWGNLTETRFSKLSWKIPVKDGNTIQKAILGSYRSEQQKKLAINNI